MSQDTHKIVQRALKEDVFTRTPIVAILDEDFEQAYGFFAHDDGLRILQSWYDDECEPNDLWLPIRFLPSLKAALAEHERLKGDARSQCQPAAGAGEAEKASLDSTAQEG